MNLYDVIKNLLSLKSQWLNLKQANMYSKLTLCAHKLLIKQAVEAAFEGVKVANVNTVNVKPKAKRVGRYTGFTSKTKKLSSRLQLILKQSSCLLLKLNNLRRKYRGNSCL